MTESVLTTTVTEVSVLESIFAGKELVGTPGAQLQFLAAINGAENFPIETLAKQFSDKNFRKEMIAYFEAYQRVQEHPRLIKEENLAVIAEKFNGKQFPGLAGKTLKLTLCTIIFDEKGELTGVVKKDAGDLEYWSDSYLRENGLAWAITQAMPRKGVRRGEPGYRSGSLSPFTRLALLALAVTVVATYVESKTHVFSSILNPNLHPNAPLSSDGGNTGGDGGDGGNGDTPPTKIGPVTTPTISAPSTEVSTPTLIPPTPTETYDFQAIEQKIFDNPNWERFGSLEEFTQTHDIETSIGFVHAVDNQGQLHVALNPTVFMQLMQEGGTAFLRLNPSLDTLRVDRNELVLNWLKLGGKIKMPEKIIDNDTQIGFLLQWLDEWEPLDEDFDLIDEYAVMIGFKEGRDRSTELRSPIVWYPALGNLGDFIEKLVALGYTRDQLLLFVMMNEPTPEFLDWLSEFSQIGL